MPKDDQTADLFEADGVTPVKKAAPVITAEQLEAERRASRAEGETAGLKTALAAKPDKPKTEPKEFSRADLRVKVNAGELTEDQMDDILEDQNRKKILRLVDEKVESRVVASQAGVKVSDQIDAYVGVFPDINKEGSATRAKIQAAFDELVALGDKPDVLTTELKAIKMALGPLKTGAGRRPAPDSHEDVGAGSDGIFKGLSSKMKKHYETAINKGIYKSASDPRLVAELKLARGRPN